MFLAEMVRLRADPLVRFWCFFVFASWAWPWSGVHPASAIRGRQILALSQNWFLRAASRSGLRCWTAQHRSVPDRSAALI